ncbi:hypothetical protein AWW68_19475 [Roseivirga spongicola]|uniref:Cytosine-specific methyltransferase n=1 Tax=Roseivirga spongicola TaxID=333140 RepID=A0A150XCJ8_9BACT|nr:hypothetical protein AWW68_19475 [Roseivirga spongicola]
MTLLSLFGGIDGFALGFQRAGYSIETHYYSEIDKYASAVVRHRFKQAIHVGSVKDIQGSELKRPDIITFGSPCQDFSLAGKRAGMDGERSSLILEAIRLITEARPSVFIWENVKGAFSSNSGADFTAILQAFANIGGYRLEWQLLNTKWLLPQNRERIYLVGHLAEAGSRQVFPIGETCEVFIKKRERVSGRVLSKSPDDVANCITSRYYKMGRTDNYIQVKTNQSNSKESGVIQIMDKKNFGNSTKQQDRVYDPSGIMACLGSNRLESKCNIQIDREVGEGKKIRRLTEIECERLQGFPDNWTQYGDFGDGIVKEISATQRYKMCGNAVTTDVVKLIAERL